MGINLPIYALNFQAVFLDEVYALPDKDRQFNSIMTFASWGRQLQRDPKHKRVLSLSLKYIVEQIMIEIKTITTEVHTAYLYWIESICRRYFSFKNPYSFTQVKVFCELQKYILHILNWEHMQEIFFFWKSIFLHSNQSLLWSR